MNSTLDPLACFVECGRGAPLLFAIYSCWLYDAFAQRTAPGWAERLVTLFADDSHLCFEVESMAELQQAQCAIRAMFQLLHESGMQANPSKSIVWF